MSSYECNHDLPPMHSGILAGLPVGVERGAEGFEPETHRFSGSADLSVVLSEVSGTRAEHS